MRSFHNIEKSAFRKGCYVGYSHGEVYNIRRGAVEGWVAQKHIPNSPEIDVTGPRMFARTLDGISKLLAQRSEALKKVYGFGQKGA